MCLYYMEILTEVHQAEAAPDFLFSEWTLPAPVEMRITMSSLLSGSLKYQG